MKNSFNVILNDQIIYSYKAKPSPARLRRYLDEMDNDMDGGILLGDTQVENPDDFQKLQYVALELFSAIKNKNNNLSEVLSAYLSNRDEEIFIEQNDDKSNLIIK